MIRAYNKQKLHVCMYLIQTISDTKMLQYRWQNYEQDYLLDICPPESQTLNKVRQ